MDQVIARLRPKLARVPGATLFLQAVQDLRVGGRNSAAQYQYTMRGDNLNDLIDVRAARCSELSLRRHPHHRRRQQRSAEPRPASHGTYDRETAARFGISPQLIDNTLYDAFGQRQVSTMYTTLNQYHVVMEAAPQYWQNPEMLSQIYVMSPDGQEVPLERDRAIRARPPRPVGDHQGLFPAVTISFNLKPGVALGDAVEAITKRQPKVGLPATIQTGVRRHGAGLPAIARQRTVPDRGGAGDGVYRARHSLRKLHPSDHDSLHAALGGRRRAAGALNLPQRT